MNTETRTLWQRCKALGQFEDFKDDHVEMLFASGRGVIRHDGQCILFIYEDKVRGSEWLADAILCHIERIRFGTTTGSKTYCQQDLNRAGIANVCRPIPDQLPDVTYVVEAPKPTEPTQEQLKAIWDYVTHLTGEQAEYFGFQYSVIANGPQAQFELHIKSPNGCVDQWQIKIMHGHIGRYWWESPFGIAAAATMLRMPMTIPTEQWVFEEPEQFVSIPVTEWQKLREAHKTIQSILFPEIKDVEFES